MKLLIAVLGPLLFMVVTTKGQYAHDCRESDGGRLFNGNPAFYQGQQRFAQNLYRTIADAAAGSSNLVISPLSVARALSLVLQGARGSTSDQLVRLLAPGLPVNQITREYKRQIEMLTGLVFLCTPAYKFSLNDVNKIFCDRSIDGPKMNAFEDVEIRDISRQPDAVRQEINQFVERSTKDKISDLLPDDSVDRLTRLVIVNALYLKAGWRQSFEGRLIEGPFGSEKKKVTYMRSVIKRALYSANEQYQQLGLHYQGEELIFVVCLPRAGVALSVCENADFKIKDANRASVDVKIPQFKLKSESIKLKEILSQLGVSEIFDEATANFDGFTVEQELYVKEGYHKAAIELTQNGTEASAATAIVMNTRSMGPRPVAFTADRPFHFHIQHQSTNSVLFVGRYVTPQ